MGMPHLPQGGHPRGRHPPRPPRPRVARRPRGPNRHRRAATPLELPTDLRALQHHPRPRPKRQASRNAASSQAPTSEPNEQANPEHREPMDARTETKGQRMTRFPIGTEATPGPQSALPNPCSKSRAGTRTARRNAARQQYLDETGRDALRGLQGRALCVASSSRSSL